MHFRVVAPFLIFLIGIFRSSEGFLRLAGIKPFPTDFSNPIRTGLKAGSFLTTSVLKAGLTVPQTGKTCEAGIKESIGVTLSVRERER